MQCTQIGMYLCAFEKDQVRVNWDKVDNERVYVCVHVCAHNLVCICVHLRKVERD